MTMPQYTHAPSGRFPYTLATLRQDNQNVSFPEYPDEETLAEYGVYPVTPVVPDYDPSTQVLESTGCAYNAELQRWETTFQVRPLPPPTAPESVTRAQGKAALITAGLWSGVMSFVASIPDPTERALAEVALHDTQEWRRSSPFFNAAATALGLTGEQLDALFLAASKIEL